MSVFLSIPSKVECRWSNGPSLQALEGFLYIDFKNGRLGFSMPSGFSNERWYWQVPLEVVRPLLSMGGSECQAALEYKSESSREWMTSDSVLSANHREGCLRIKPKGATGEEYRFSIADIGSLLDGL